MKIKLDENLPLRLSFILTDLGHDVDTSEEEGLVGFQDEQVWEAAQREGRFLVTQDLDFSDIRHFAPGTHCGILLVRLSSPTRRSIVNRIQQIFQTENVHEWPRCFIVVSERKVRVRKPP